MGLKKIYIHFQWNNHLFSGYYSNKYKDKSPNSVRAELSHLPVASFIPLYYSSMFVAFEGLKIIKINLDSIYNVFESNSKFPFFKLWIYEET